MLSPVADLPQSCPFQHRPAPEERLEAGRNCMVDSRRNQVHQGFKSIVYSAPTNLVRRSSGFWCPACPAERSEDVGGTE